MISSVVCLFLFTVWFWVNPRTSHPQWPNFRGPHQNPLTHREPLLLAALNMVMPVMIFSFFISTYLGETLFVMRMTGVTTSGFNDGQRQLADDQLTPGVRCELPGNDWEEGGRGNE